MASSALPLALVACSSTTTSGDGEAPRAHREATELTVFAASSLTAAFTQIGTDFEAANAGTTVTFNFGSSGDLARIDRVGGHAPTCSRRRAAPTWTR